ncbi:MAG TPA: GntR family transcriptional regulator [Burkholderiaceae bacterium]|nr:GntR family transcriptional regulator [Burkholderiaceae bacterium]
MLPWLPLSSADLLADIRDTSLASLVRDDVLRAIARGELAPGQRINEPDVAARLGVSRVPVREALRELTSSGLVAARKHAGVFVRVLSPKEVADLYDLRSVLDGHAGARVAALPERRRRALLKSLSERQAQMKAGAQRHDVQAYYGANLAFHWSIVEAAGNDALSHSYRAIVQQLHLSRLKNLSRDIGMRASMLEHKRIIAAIASGDPARARTLLAEHVTASHDRLLAAEPTASVDPR